MPWIGMYRTGLVNVLRNTLDWHFVSNLTAEGREAIVRTLVEFTKLRHEVVMVFCTDAVREIALTMSFETKEAFDFVDTFFGTGDVFGTTEETQMYKKAKEKWNGTQ